MLKGKESTKNVELIASNICSLVQFEAVLLSSKYHHLVLYIPGSIQT